MADQIAAQAAPVYYVTGTIHSTETGPGLLYRAPYVAHDNNRDAMGMTLKLTQNVLDTYVGFKAQVLHDLHESGSFLYDNTIGDCPYNAWIDPLLTNEWQMYGWNNVQEMTRLGMPACSPTAGSIRGRLGI